MGPGIVGVFCGFLPIEKDGDGVGKKERKPSPFSINSLLRLACVLLTILFVVYFVKTRLDIVEMQEQLMAMEEQVELQRLKKLAMERPPKIRRYSFLLLGCMLLLYMGVMGYQIHGTMSGIF